MPALAFHQEDFDTTSESTIIKSLSRQEILDYISKYGLDAFFKFATTGNFIALFGVGSQAFIDYKQRQVFEVQSEAFEAQSEAFKAFKDDLPKFLKAIEQKKINVVPEAFNSSPTFMNTFKSAADLYAVPILLYNAIEAIKYIGHALDGIKDELSLSNVAKIQGWENDGFGSHIYRFVRSEMETASQAQREGDTRRHYFYVWHPDTSWYPTFRERIRERSL
ncbi:hypothetical protein CKAH01_14565 [Colletotrichum kahawae]|uniref:Uncharacterized protein n=1 Tax=Colletotrichum kahawae TaxID=34407 RepID=A0AAE0D8F5_COLKA|nr:hypothetical protein CKAH01_14565 [Colletotrichum kahawae]